MATPARNLVLALIAALCLHAALFVPMLVFKKITLIKQQSLRVTILQQELRQPSPKIELPIEQQNVDLVAKTTSPPRPIVSLEDVIAVSASTNSAEPRIRIQTSQQSRFFQNWLKSETTVFTNRQPDSVASFDKTFEVPSPNETPKGLSPYNPKAVPRGGTTFATELRGKRTCFVKDMNLLDITVDAMLVSKDCTPEKEFDLKLNQPNNGWSDR